MEWRDPRDVDEEDRKPLPPLAPRLAPECEHPEEGDVGVERDRERERARAGGIRVRQLERDEREDRDRARVAAEALRVDGERARLPAEALPDPDEEVCKRAPGAEPAPDVPEQEREKRQ